MVVQPGESAGGGVPWRGEDHRVACRTCQADVCARGKRKAQHAGIKMNHNFPHLTFQLPAAVHIIQVS